MRASFNGTALTGETITKTREHFANIHRDCIRAAEAGEFHVNDVIGYRAWQEDCIRAVMDEGARLSLTFLQRAYWLQTGKCVALLPAYEGA